MNSDMNLKTVLINGKDDYYKSVRQAWLSKLKLYEDHFSTVGYKSYLAFISERFATAWDHGTETYAVLCEDSNDVKAFFELSKVHPSSEKGYLKVLGIRMCPSLDSRIPDEEKEISEMDRLIMISNIAAHVFSESMEIAKEATNCSLIKILTTKQVDREIFVSFANRINKTQSAEFGFDVRKYSGGLWLEICLL